MKVPVALFPPFSFFPSLFVICLLLLIITMIIGSSPTSAICRRLLLPILSSLSVLLLLMGKSGAVQGNLVMRMLGGLNESELCLAHKDFMCVGMWSLCVCGCHTCSDMFPPTMSPPDKHTHRDSTYCCVLILDSTLQHHKQN